MKTPSQLATWTGDISMKLHADKPGSSESVSISDIVSLINAEGTLKLAILSCDQMLHIE